MIKVPRILTEVGRYQDSLLFNFNMKILRSGVYLSYNFLRAFRVLHGASNVPPNAYVIQTVPAHP
jgi:hypothetical protein